jgi:transcriptional regulator of acetoin/glycerol metabolism
LKALEKHRWYGNIREMKGVIDSACFDTSGASIGVDDLKITAFEEIKSPVKTADTDSAIVGRRPVDIQRDKLYKASIEAHGGNISAAAKSLGITRQALHAWKVKQG